MNTPATGTPETKGPGAEAPGPFNQGAAAASRLAPHEIVARAAHEWKRTPRRFIKGEPAPGRVIEGRRVAGWHRTNTGASGQAKIFSVFYTDLAVEFEDGETEYVVCVTEKPL
jgi:hypothetical protein